MRIAIILLLSWTLASCSRNKESVKVTDLLFIPSHFDEMIIPDDNPITTEKVVLGKLFFEDVRLSKNNTISCMSCHKVSMAMGDTAQFSVGYLGELTERNSISLFNLGYHTSFFRDGGAPTLEMQAVAPIENPIEMNMNVLDVCSRLDKDTMYHRMAQEIFGTNVTPFVLTRSLATYLRTLISANSPYDDFMQGNEEALTSQEKVGMELFNGKAKCSQCHEGFNFTNYKFENNGAFKIYADPGRRRITINDADEGKFKVASLRNLSYSAPYMHNGAFKTLEEVIENYNLGGSDHWNKSEKIVPLNLTIDEKEKLKLFLLSLNDAKFVGK